MEKNNDGFSLVELIIVVAIIAIMSTFAFYGLGYLSRADAKGCAQDINSTISSVKTTTMSKTQPLNMFLYCYDGNYYIKTSNKPSVTFDDGSGSRIIGSASSMKVSCDGTELTDGHGQLIQVARKDGTFSAAPSHIVVDGGGKYSIYLIKNTGKHFVRTDG